jgi:hypothetical protein
MWTFIAVICIALLAWLLNKAVRGTPFEGCGP